MVLLIAGIRRQSLLELPFRLGQVLPPQKVQAQAPMGLSQFVVQDQRDFILATRTLGRVVPKESLGVFAVHARIRRRQSHGFTILLQGFVKTPVRHQTVADHKMHKRAIASDTGRVVEQSSRVVPVTGLDKPEDAVNADNADCRTDVTNPPRARYRPRNGK